MGIGVFFFIFVTEHGWWLSQKRFSMSGNDPTNNLALMMTSFEKTVQTVENYQKNCSRQQKSGETYSCDWMQPGTINLMLNQRLEAMQVRDGVEELVVVELWESWRQGWDPRGRNKSFALAWVNGIVNPASWHPPPVDYSYIWRPCTWHHVHGWRIVISRGSGDESLADMHAESMYQFFLKVSLLALPTKARILCLDSL